MSISINVTQTIGGSFTAAGVTTDSINLTVGGGVGPPGAGNVALAAGDGILITSTANVATINCTVQGVPESVLENLSNVFSQNATTGDVLAYNGTAWAASSDFATLTYVDNAVSNLVDAAPGALDTLNELAAAIGDDANFSATITTSLASKAAANHTHTFQEITNGTATVTGNLTLNASTGGVIINGGTSSGSLTLNCENNTHGVTIESPAHSANATYTLTLPSSAGSANQVLTTDGSGALSWSNGSSGSISWTTPAPGNSSDSGSAGDVAYGGQYFYLHNGTQWNRVLLSSFGNSNGSSNVTTYRILTEGSDPLLAEGGDYINHDGTGAGNGTGGSTWSLVNAEIEPYRSTGWLQFGGNGTLVAPYQEGNDLVLADNGTAWQSSLTRSQYDSLTGYSHATNYWLKSVTRNSGGDLNAELLLARDANVAFGMAVDTGPDRYIYRLQLQSGTWSKSPSAALSFGSSAGNLLAACSRNGDYFVVDFGSAFISVYDASGTGWSLVGSYGGINLTGVLTDDTQVRRLGISNNGLVCSVAVENTHDAASNKFDRIRSFEWTGSAWAERTALTVAASYVCDWTPDHSRVVVGQYDHTGTATQGGRVQVFSLSGSTWSQVGSDIVGAASYDYLGYSVSISSDGNTIAVGVRGEDDAGANAGAARVYEWSGSDWQQVGADIDGEAAGDYAGDQVELAGGRVAISAPGADGAGTDRGQVRVFSTS